MDETARLHMKDRMTIRSSGGRLLYLSLGLATDVSTCGSGVGGVEFDVEASVEGCSGENNSLIRIS